MKPAEVSRNDQRHAELRQLIRHMREHIADEIATNASSDVAFAMGHALTRSAYTREMLAYLLGVALVEMEAYQ